MAVLYAVVFLAGGLISGVDYDEITQTASNVFGFVVVPVGLGILATLALTWRWGWWRPLFTETRRLEHPRWARLIPVAIVLYVVVALAFAPWGDWSAGLVALILAATLMVGFGEEIVFRGYLLVGARGRYSELGAWFVTSGLFGLFHGLNIFTGQSVGATIQQVVFAFLIGSSFYLVRRVTGLLVAGMVLHGLWDFTTFISSGRGEAADAVSGSALAASPFVWITAILTVATLVSIFRGRDAAQEA